MRFVPTWLTSLLVFAGTSVAHADKLQLVVGDSPKTAEGLRIGMPFGMAHDQQRNLYIADYSDHRVWKLDPQGVLTVYAGTGKKGFSGDGGPATQGQFAAMHDLVVAANGDLFIADSDNRRVRKIDGKTGILSTLAGTGEKKIAGDGGPAEKASLDGVASLWLKDNQLYLTGFSSVVRVIDLTTGIIERVAGIPGGRSVAVDSKGNIYVGGGTTLRVLKPDGKLETLHDSKTAAPDEVKIGNNTKHLGFDAEENVLIADDFGHQIKKYVLATKKLMVVAGNGKKGTAGLDGPPLAAQLDSPHAVYYDSVSKTIFIGDSRNKRLLKIVP